MATLSENIARTKENFRNIRDAINVVGDAVAYEPLINEPVEEYPARINDVTEMYGQSKYDEGYEHGKADGGGGVDLSKCKYIEKQATGKVISLNDVSEVAHKVKVYGDNQEVEVYGKNLCDYTKFTGISSVDKANVILDNDTFIFPAGNTYYGLIMTDGITLVKGQTYTFSYEATTAYAYPECQIIYTDDTRIVVYNGKTITIADKDIKEIKFYLVGGAIAETDAKLSKFQVELGTKGTDYELPTHQTITATPSGTEIDSMCPNMNFIADSDITVDYYSSFGMAEKELAMWNAITANGARKVYDRAFAYTDYSGYSIPTGLCKPIEVIGTMFYSYKGTELPRGIDCSEFNVSTTTISYHCQNTFAHSTNLKHIYDMGIPAVKSYSGFCRTCRALESIEIIRVSEESVFDGNAFNDCSKLTHCIFSGIIASDINMQWSKLLNKESLVSLSVTLAHFITTEMNPEGSNVPSEPWTRTITLSPESWAILDNTPYPDAPMMSCTEFITTVKAWNKA